MIGDPTRAGDLAISISPTDPPEFQGLWFDVLQEIGDKRVVRIKHDFQCRKGEWLWIARRHEQFTVPDEVLKPIRPPAPEQSVKREEHLSEVV